MNIQRKYCIRIKEDKYYFLGLRLEMQVMKDFLKYKCVLHACVAAISRVGNVEVIFSNILSYSSQKNCKSTLSNLWLHFF